MLDLKRRHRIIVAVFSVFAILLVAAVFSVFYFKSETILSQDDENKIMYIEYSPDAGKYPNPITDNSMELQRPYPIENYDTDAVIGVIEKYSERKTLNYIGRVGYSTINYDFNILIMTENGSTKELLVGENGRVRYNNERFWRKINDSAALRDELYEILGLEK